MGRAAFLRGNYPLAHLMAMPAPKKQSKKRASKSSGRGKGAATAKKKAAGKRASSKRSSSKKTATAKPKKSPIPEHEIVRMKVADLFPDPNNPRRISDKAAAGLGAGIKRFGYVGVPVFNKRTKELVGGHQGRDRLLELGVETVPTMVVNLSRKDQHALNVLLNNPHIAGEFTDGLEDYLVEIEESFGEDLFEELGFQDLWDEHYEEAAAGEGVNIEEAQEGEDYIPPPPAKPKTKPGEIVTLGRHTLHCADCMSVMAALPDNSVDAIVCDPPYGLSPDGKARTWDDIEKMREEARKNVGKRGASKERKLKGFMGKEWDAAVPGVTWARECLRVLKPGGYLIAFASTRTEHRLTCSIEDAGFEIRDKISWLQWQGFPKSLDLSKAIDGHHGAEREVVGSDGRTAKSENTLVNFGMGFGDWELTAPATDDAKRWAGWGTALKPSQEPAVLARKPLEGTVAENVLKWGTGGLNIEACAHQQEDESWPGPWNESAPKWPGNIYACPKPARGEKEPWLDSPELFCNCETWAKGDREVATRAAEGRQLRRDITASGARNSGDSDSLTTSSGRKQTDPSQTGTRSTTSTGTVRTTGSKTSNASRGRNTSASTGAVRSATESGGSHAGSAESTSGSERRTGTSARRDGRSTGGAGRATSRSSSRRSGCERCGKPVPPKARHETVKPVALMRWLLKLVCPPGAHVLEPFLGSGTTMVAARTLDLHITGVELDPAHCDIIRARVAHSETGSPFNLDGGKL